MAKVYYTDFGLDQKWNEAESWSNFTIPGLTDDVYIQNGVQQGQADEVQLFDGNTYSVNPVTIDNGDWLEVANPQSVLVANAITVGTAQGSTLYINDSGKVEVANNGTLNIGGTVNGAAGYGELLIGGSGTVSAATVALNALSSTLVFDTANSFTFSTTITGSGSIQQSSTRTVTLTGAETYKGTTSVDAGSKLVFSNSGTTFLYGAVQGAGTLEFNGGGLFELVGNGSFSGTATIDAGTSLTIGGNTASGSLGSGALVDNGTLYLFRTDAATVGDLISGSGTVYNYSGTATLTNSNTYTGATTVAAGTLKAGNASAFGQNSVTSVSSGATLDVAGFGVTIANLSGAGTVDNSSSPAAQLSVDSINGQSSTFSGVIEDTGAALSLFKALFGTLTLSGANSYTGTTEVSAGTLVVQNTSTTAAVGVLGKGTVRVDTNALLTFRNADRVDDGYLITNTLSGTGTVDFQGPDGSDSGTKSSVTTLNVANTYSLQTNISSGIINLNSNAAFGTSAVSMTGGAIRATDAPRTLANNFTLSGTIGLGAATNISGAVTLVGSTALPFSWAR